MSALVRFTNSIVSGRCVAYRRHRCTWACALVMIRPSFKHIHGKHFNHRRIKHGAKVYVDGDIHTNTIEGFWSLIGVSKSIN